MLAGSARNAWGLASWECTMTSGDEQRKYQQAGLPSVFADKRVVIGGGALLVAVIGFGVFMAGRSGSDESVPTSTTLVESQTTSSIVAGVTPTTVSETSGGGDAETPVATSAPVSVNPLTGEALDSANTGQVIAVKVDNGPAAQGQIGLRQAGVIFEVPVEGGLTRFTALFFDDVPIGVGPARSLRPVDADLLGPFSPIVITTGGRPWVVRDVEAAGVTILSDAEFFDQIVRQAPSNLLALAAKADAASVGGPPGVQPFRFGDSFDGDPVSVINIPLSGVMDVSWAVGGNGWVRTQNDSVFQVADTFDGDISDFSVDTVIVMMVAQRFAGYEDSAGAPVPTFDVIGFGRVMVFSDGQVIEGEWRRAAQEDGWIFVSDAGEEILIPKGRLFVEIVPRFVDITFE